MTFFEQFLNMIPGVVIPVRSVLIPLKNSALLVSPIDFSDKQIDAIRKLTPVTDIVMPTIAHHKFALKAVRKFPGANLWAPKGYKEKYPELSPNKTLDVDVWPFKDEVELIPLRGAPRMNECVLFHRDSKTLIVMDLVFNIQNPRGFLAPVMLRMMGIYKRFRISMFWKKMVKDRAAFNASLEKLLALDFDRLVMAHGDVVETTPDSSAKDALRTALIERGFISDAPLLAAPRN